jgi:uroporphyrin-III C-methyltransferase/precorrin-2 dehydrogenase/sirohydrochlorin ferrochelatase
VIEGLLPESFSRWATTARDLRRGGADLGNTPGEKRSFWQRFTDFALRQASRGPTQSDIDQLIADAPASRSREPVTVVDVGDDADALTLGAIRALRAADDIFFDEDVPATVADFARREARRHPVASGQASSVANIEKLAAAAVHGRVVRLRRLDLQPESRQKEIIAIRAAGVPVIVLSSGLAR